MSDDEDQTQFFGTALPELPNDVIPTKKPITVADQIAVDANGRRRFHGAFTGGFSAGYWNTVGSQEGWKPQSFKSSRLEKAERVAQNAKDFMDDEDVGEFGINPQRIQTTTDFTDDRNKKRPSASASSGEAGNPVLDLFLIPARDKACVRLLKKMGWRGETSSTFSRKQPKKDHSSTKVYNCSMGPMLPQRSPTDDHPDSDESSDSNSSMKSIKFDLDDFEILTHTPKVNRFGLGYVGLMAQDQNKSQLQHINLFAPFEVRDRKNNKKLSITGQAFGVGAFEEDDDDIYAVEDMTKYNFEATKAQEQIMPAKKEYQNTIEGFKPGATKSYNKTKFTIQLAAGYRPRNWLERKSRFGPVVNERVLEQAAKDHKPGTGRHMMTPDEPGAVLDQKPKHRNPFAPITLKNKPTLPETVAQTVEDRLKKLSETFDKRFVSEKTVDAPKRDDGLSQMADTFESRFVTEQPVTIDAAADKDSAASTKPPDKAPEIVVKMKRETTPWFPSELLCQKMNIADPTKCKEKSNQAPFSLLAHVNPFAGTRQREKEFATSTKNEDEVIVNAYVPQKAAAVPKAQPPPTPLSVEPAQEEHDARHKPPVFKVAPAKPKTELELNIQKMAKSHPSEKKDIYKAVFESSDEEDSDRETGDQDDANATEVADIPTPSFLMPKRAEDVNILRNTSPPRGIFAGLAQKSVPESVRQVFRSTSSLVEKEDAPDPVAENVLPDAYGPSLPGAQPAVTAAASGEMRIAEAAPKRKHGSDSSDDSTDEWVTKDNDERSRKKAKKLKHKHKKSKSKSKKSKKSKKSHR